MTLRRFAATLALTLAAFTATPMAHAATLTSVLTLSDGGTLLNTAIRQTERSRTRTRAGLPIFDDTLGVLNSVQISVEHYTLLTLDLNGTTQRGRNPNRLIGNARSGINSLVSVGSLQSRIREGQGNFRLRCVIRSGVPCTATDDTRYNATPSLLTLTGTDWTTLVNSRRNPILLRTNGSSRNFAGESTATYTTFADLTFTFDYTPAPVPLPAGVLLLLGALGGLGAIARRR